MESHNQDELEATHNEYSNPRLNYDYGSPTHNLELSFSQLLLLNSVLSAQTISVAPLNDLRLKVTQIVESIPNITYKTMTKQKLPLDKVLSKNINVQIREDEHKALVLIGEKLGRSKSYVMRMALQNLLKEDETTSFLRQTPQVD